MSLLDSSFRSRITRRRELLEGSHDGGATRTCGAGHAGRDSQECARGGPGKGSSGGTLGDVAAKHQRDGRAAFSSGHTTRRARDASFMQLPDSRALVDL